MIFLIGAARSGTKFLRDLLAESEVASCIPFDVNYVWRYRNESAPSDMISPDLATREVAEYIRHTLAYMAERASGRTCPAVIEKTVSNVFRVPFILRIFPNAKFVHLVRDGRDVALSAARQWTAPSDVSYLMEKLRYFPVKNWAYGVWYLKDTLRNRLEKKQEKKTWGPRYPGINEDIGKRSIPEIAARQWSESVFAAHTGFASVPEKQKLSIRYEDLVSDSKYLRQLAEFLELPDIETIVEHYDERVRRDKGGAWDQLPDEEQRRLMSILEPALLKFGYLN